MIASSQQTQLVDLFTAVKAIQVGSAANAPLAKLDPADPAVFWTPAMSYSYELAPLGTPLERDALRAYVVNTAGAGKL